MKLLILLLAVSIGAQAYNTKPITPTKMGSIDLPLPLPSSREGGKENGGNFPDSYRTPKLVDYLELMIKSHGPEFLALLERTPDDSDNGPLVLAKGCVRNMLQKGFKAEMLSHPICGSSSSTCRELSNFKGNEENIKAIAMELTLEKIALSLGLPPNPQCNFMIYHGALAYFAIRGISPSIE